MARTLTIAALALAASLPSLEAVAQSSDRERAMELFEQSAEAYRAGSFEEAAGLLREAYALEPAPVLQYNLARALEGLGDLEGSVTAYETFLEAEPDTDDRGAIEARLRTLRRRIDERRGLQAVARVSEPAPASTGRELDPVPWIVAGAGLCGLLAGVGVAIAAVEQNGAADDEPVHERAVALRSEAEDLALAANVTFAVAGTVALAGAVWGTIALVSEPGTEGTQVSLVPTPTGLSVRGRF